MGRKTKKNKLHWIERLARWLERKGRRRVIWRETFTERGWDDRNPETTVHVGTIQDDTSPTGVRNKYREKYLERYYLFRSKWFAIFIHRFWSSDLEPLHDHPWDNFSWVIKGGYWENLPDGQRLWRGPGFKKFRTAEEFHRLDIPEDERGRPMIGETWTIFARLRRRRKWGFWYPDGWKPAAVQSGSDEVFG
jgi:hypothetical protein